MNTMKPTATMMRNLRGRFGLDDNDTSKDEAIMEMSPEDMVRECVVWELGDPSWASRIAGWMKAVGAKPENF